MRGSGKGLPLERRWRGFSVTPGSTEDEDEDEDVLLQYVTAEWAPAFQRQAREFPFLPLLPRGGKQVSSHFRQRN